jgi:3-dehydroquinate synthetase
VATGLLARLPAALAPATPAFVVADENTLPLLPPALAHLPRHVLPPGEASKSWAELERLLLALDAAGLDRDSHLVAFGGGVVTDLAGLAASLHRRGIPWSAVPTSLVGQVDAACGGKTAIDFAGGKNTIGSFHPPRAVLVDPAALASLPGEHLRAGLAEVLKTALIAGGELYARTLELDLPALVRADARATAVIAGCLSVKDGLVRRDLHDHGPRRALNLGHTFGHALEALSLRTPGAGLLHGEAVALGLLCAARVAGTRRGVGAGLEHRLRDRLSAWGLGTTRSGLDPDAVLAEMRRDKKRRGGRLTLILPLAPGRVEVLEGLDDDVVRIGLGALTPGC